MNPSDLQGHINFTEFKMAIDNDDLINNLVHKLGILQNNLARFTQTLDLGGNFDTGGILTCHSQAKKI